jgi:hypothetical protein
VVEGLAEASAFTQDSDVMDALQLSLAVIGTESVTSGKAVRYGKDLLIEARYIPTMLAILKQDTDHFGSPKLPDIPPAWNTLSLTGIDSPSSFWPLVGGNC